MDNILSIIKSKNPEDVTQKELQKFQLLIEETQQQLNKLQVTYRGLTGRDYVPYYVPLNSRRVLELKNRQRRCNMEIWVPTKKEIEYMLGNLEYRIKAASAISDIEDKVLGILAEIECHISNRAMEEQNGKKDGGNENETHSIDSIGNRSPAHIRAGESF